MAYPRDPQCVALFYVLGSEEYKESYSQLSAHLRASLHQYFIDNGLLCYRTEVADTARIVVLHNEDVKYRILFEAHDTALSGHLGPEKTYGSVIQHYWWPKLYKWVSTYVHAKRASG